MRTFQNICSGVWYFSPVLQTWICNILKNLLEAKAAASHIPEKNTARLVSVDRPQHELLENSCSIHHLKSPL
jgi:hypothetical protein